MTWNPVERVPETHFGGQQTVNNPFPLNITGRVEWESGFDSYFVTLNPQDIVNYRLLSGHVYASGSHLAWVLPHTRINDDLVKGNLLSFEVSPLALVFGETEFPLTVETPIKQNVQSVGEGSMRVLHSVLLQTPSE